MARFRCEVDWAASQAYLTLITDNWLKPASPELKRVVGQELNKLKAHVEQVLVERQKDHRGCS